MSGVILDRRMRFNVCNFEIPLLDAAEESTWRLGGKDPGPMRLHTQMHVFAPPGSGKVRQIRLRSAELESRELREFLALSVVEPSIQQLIFMKTNLLDLYDGAETEIKYRQHDGLEVRIEMPTEVWTAYSAWVRAGGRSNIFSLIIDCDAKLEIA